MLIQKLKTSKVKNRWNPRIHQVCWVVNISTNNVSSQGYLPLPYERHLLELGLIKKTRASALARLKKVNKMLKK